VTVDEGAATGAGRAKPLVQRSGQHDLASGGDLGRAALPDGPVDSPSSRSIAMIGAARLSRPARPRRNRRLPGPQAGNGTAYRLIKEP
jgi:hypothetical protein